MEKQVINPCRSNEVHDDFLCLNLQDTREAPPPDEIFVEVLGR